MKHSAFDAAISALDVDTSALDMETSAFGVATSVIARRSFDAETSAIAWSYRRYRRGVSSDIGDCGVGITPQMCNRVTNHGDVSTFSKPVQLMYYLDWNIEFDRPLKTKMSLLWSTYIRISEECI